MKWKMRWYGVRDGLKELKSSYHTMDAYTYIIRFLVEAV